MEQQQCIICGHTLRPSNVKYHITICGPCQSQKRLVDLLDENFIKNAFVTIWAKGFFIRLSIFLKERETPIESQAKMLPKALKIFQEAEAVFHRPDEISEQWLETMIEQAGHGLLPTFFRHFLIQEHLLLAPNLDEKKIKALQRKIEQVSPGYRWLVEVYFRERLALRERDR